MNASVILMPALPISSVKISEARMFVSVTMVLKEPETTAYVSSHYTSHCVRTVTQCCQCIKYLLLLLLYHIQLTAIHHAIQRGAALNPMSVHVPVALRENSVK